MSTYPSDQLEKFSIRLPIGMRDLIRGQARANKRSMNAEIVYQLQRAYHVTEKEKAA
ncbi:MULTISPECIES: Arc family DNA-binding protein [unclassified Marinobacter]|uniref:Arc family DNA-binding protein n=1 Tax=unclassified Marinobacter TaxID=83889 RepID=UPI0019272886|nr:Arc family DNA-binding protein [Marinobacter sp. MC3]MBL3825180.1 Arc family DNA-binding protein [Marinobacter sp. MC3]MBL3893616.1 Arc family DNA-binding protein [Marinobacter sp. MW3]